ncbi:MAG: serine/threonine-protein phosphatase [Anaerolineaceae bacterium]|nr:serine/threonine-protein phosphatase [Anaerolineaceae bacterium]
MKEFFEKLLGKKKAKSSTIETAPLSADQLGSVSQQRVYHTPTQMLVGSAQSNGRQRDHNEDTLLALNTVLSDGSTEVTFGIFIIADGMGGHQNGEIASSRAARVMADYLLFKLYPTLLGVRFDNENDSLQEIMENGVSKAQQAVVSKAPGGGTTLTAALVIGDQVTIAQVGDSRAYFLHPDGRIQMMTQDHSLVRRLVELGQINEKEASNHPQRNVLYRAIGQSEPFRPDINTHLLPNPGYMLLCSDGLWSVVPEIDIFRVVKAASSPAEACRELVGMANSAGGPDNISVILVHRLE